MNEDIIKKFDDKLYQLYETAKRECNYNAVRFLQMLRENRAYQTAKSLLNSAK